VAYTLADPHRRLSRRRQGAFRPLPGLAALFPEPDDFRYTL